MADAKISELPSATPQSGDQFPFVRDGVTSRGSIGTMALQDANNVAVTGGTINNTSIGATTANTGAFTTVSASTSATTPLVTNAGTLALSATGANIITASTNGSERVRIDSDGDVGIGTSSPTQKLTVDGNVAVGGQQAFWLRDDDGFSGSSTRRAWAMVANADTLGALSFKVSNAAGGNPLSGTSAMLITSAGNVGIGTSSPAVALDVQTGTFATGYAVFGKANEGGKILFRRGFTGGAVAGQLGFDSATGLDFGLTGATDLFFDAGGTERMRIDSAGNVGIGVVPSSLIGANWRTLLVKGVASEGAGVYANWSGDETCQSLWTSNNNFIEFGSVTNHPVQFRTNSTDRLRITTAGVVEPCADNTQTLGAASFRWSEVFAGNGTINTSDAREKTAVRALTAAEIAAAKDLAKEIGAFQFLAAVEKKGDDARTHIGMTVQKAIEIMEAHDLDPMAYGFICHDEWEEMTVDHPAIEAVEGQEAWTETIEHEAELDDDGEVVKEAWTETIEHPAVEAVEAKEAWTETTLEAGDRYGFRVDQLLLFMARGFEARLTALEGASE